MYARIQDGVVTDLRSDSPVGCFTDNIVAEFVTVPDTVQNGWSFDGTNFAPPPGPTQAQIDAEAARAAAAVVAEAARQAAQARATAKVARAQAVEAIQVTTAAGNTFDGDELSQGRMSRAIIALSTGLAPSVTWVLADNSTIQATAAELTEALVLAGMAQAAIWVI